MSNPIQQTVTFNASPHEVYELLMDSAKHSAFSGDPSTGSGQVVASVSREVGGAFSAHGGYITGKNLELVPDQKIVQSWHAVDWPAEHFSTVTFLLLPIPGGTRLNFTQLNVPDGTEAEFAEGWIENYWKPMQAMLEKA